MDVGNTENSRFAKDFPFAGRRGGGDPCRGRPALLALGQRRTAPNQAVTMLCQWEPEARLQSKILNTITMKILLRTGLLLFLVGYFPACATRPAGSTVLPDHSRFAKPIDSSLAVESVADGSIHSPWKWKIRTPRGTWQLTCRHAGPQDGDRFRATLIFADGRKLKLPDKVVTAACRAISESPDLTAWESHDGTIYLCLGGVSTATRSQGTFAIKDRRLTGWSLREVTDSFPGKPPTVWQENYEVPSAP